MKNILKMFFVALMGLLLLAGCRTSPIYNVNNVLIPEKIATDKVFNSIDVAGHALGWNIEKVKPGLARGTLHLRTHTAIVNIPYTANSYSIIYKNSTNLRYDQKKGTIHSNYNGWVSNLKKQIDFELSYEGNK